ncbi:sulfatase-like hydrolase/transferase [Chelativorans sp. M5D2P16]|uniref:sulfatase-like hydrolase/transferase n=1 Tax=Chelativorans sp. M5D2P16 TaxID=3095678 RepID=UPI002ACAA883|nr:sulfatase-like hydrolase/transferase [Chelativorans sp. M5D2P16]MDZ5695846.1 sulfatase-like hydrolase/transferase [Chelativorans sp. M5D2P16]
MADGPHAMRESRAAGLWDRTYPLHPFLFAAAAVFALWVRNLNHASPADIAPSLLGSLAFALVLYLAVSALRRRFDATGAVIASIWVAGVLFYADLFGRLNGLLDGGYSMLRSLPVALLVLAVVTVAALRLRRITRFSHSVLNGIALVLFITPAWQAASYEWRHGEARAAYDGDRAYAEMQQHLPANAEASRPPDIYHFVFDRYASEEVLARHYGLDNSAIVKFLEEHGFYVAHASNSNYQKTGHSLASTFYMDYLDVLADDGRATGANWHPIYKMLDDHRVARFLKARGYDFIQFGSWWVGTFHNPLADENRPHGFSEFGMLYLRRTMLKPLFHALPDTPLTMRLDWDNAQCQRVARQVEEIRAIGPREEPVYVFAHFLVPHGPYPFAADGRCLGQKESAERGSRQGFIDQVAYANRIIEEIVTTLQGEDREPPIILIQADEGPFPERDGRVPWQQASTEELRIKTGILNAYYFPNGDYRLLRPDITPVNSYRVLFNSYFGGDFPLLADRIFAFPNDGTLYEFHDVTRKVRAPAHMAGGAPGEPPSGSDELFAPPPF